MKSSLIFGFIFLLIGGVLGYIQYTDQAESVLTSTLIIGILLGAGIGLILGAIMGYSSKAQSVRRKNEIHKEAEIIKRASEEKSSTGNI